MVECRQLAMPIPPSSDVTHYRVTFFFGPEPAEHRPGHVRCVFNVKKRSWKGGVQVAVDVAQDSLVRARRQVDYRAWLGKALQRVEQADHEAVTRRADDLLIQAFCTCTLNLAIQRGLEQENQVIVAEAFADDLDRVIEQQPEQLTELIRLELDLEDVPDPSGPPGSPVPKP